MTTQAISAWKRASARARRSRSAADRVARGGRALDRGRRLCTRRQLPLQVVHAAPREAVGARSGGDTLASIRKRIERDLDDDAIDIRVEEGEPADVILDVAGRSDSDLIVLGDASGTPGRRLLGNTVETLVRSAPASVLVVKQRPRDDYRRVLVGTDLTPESRHGLAAAAALFPAAGFTLLPALDIPYESLWLDARHRADLTRMDMAPIQAFAAQARLPADLQRRSTDGRHVGDECASQ